MKIKTTHGFSSISQDLQGQKPEDEDENSCRKLHSWWERILEGIGKSVLVKCLKVLCEAVQQSRLPKIDKAVLIRTRSTMDAIQRSGKQISRVKRTSN